MLDRLPETVIFDLIDEFPQLGLTNKRLFALAELRTRTRLLSYFNYNDENVDELAEDVRDSLHVDSWRVVEGVAHRDYWFFGPEHVVEPDADSAGHGSKRKKGYHTINGAPWGLYVVRWSNQYLEYTTMLRAGRYSVFLDMLAPQLHELSKTRITVVKSPTAKQYFRSTPPLRWLERQLQNAGTASSAKPASSSPEEPMGPDASNDAAGSGHVYTRPSALNFAFEPTKLLVGALDVDPSETSEWVEVTLRIENLDWCEPSGVIFNYLCFSPQDTNVNLSNDWAFQPPEPYGGPSHALSLIYKRANMRKRKWFEELQSKT